GVLTGDATDSTMMGTTYRQAESEMHQQLIGQLTTLTGLVQTAGAALLTTSTAHTAPITGPVIGAPTLATGANSLLSASQIITQMMTQLQTFEAKSGTFLSQKNKSD